MSSVGTNGGSTEVDALYYSIDSSYYAKVDINAHGPNACKSRPSIIVLWEIFTALIYAYDIFVTHDWY
jgi:hypothetical protein